jgi:hypothetical protein
MNPGIKILSILLFLLVSSLAIGQCPNSNSACSQGVPRLLKFNGILRDPAGKPRTGTVGIMFSIYGDSTGGAPLWQETQNVQLDSRGRYTVVLGSSTTEGIPLNLFTSGDPRWLAVQVLLPGEDQQPRAMLVSVPYALRAADAETLGGLPPSAFAKLIPNTPGQVVLGTVPTSEADPVSAAGTSAQNSPVNTPGGTTNTIPKFAVSPAVVDSQITDSKGIVSLKNLANIFFADQFPDGVPGAVAACPAEGCTIYAGSPSVSRNLGTIDPGDKLITIYLGPFTYNVKQITLRKSLRIIGMGASIPGTILQSVNGNDPVFVIPQGSNLPVTNVLLSGLRIVGSVGNTSEDAFFLDASTLVNSGLWYSELNDLTIYQFAGNGLHLRGPSTNFGALNQWLQFNNVFVTRTPGGGNALRIEGGNFQLHFTNCEFDGPGIGDGTNIYIGGLSGSNFAFPFDITFRGLVTQAAAVAVQLDGAETVTFQTSHHELVWGVYSITGNSNIWNRDISIVDSVFNSNVGVNNGTGYLVNVGTSLAQGIYFVHNRLASPDSVVTAVNGSQVVYQDNEYLGQLNVPPTSGITTQISAASQINIGGAHSIGISPNASGTPVTTIQSSLGPGETVTFAALGGSVIFATGGNIGLPGANTVTVAGTITFIRNDLAGSQGQWWPVSQWTASSAGATPPGFTLSPDAPASASVTAGDTAVYKLTVAPSGGFSGPVAFSCAGSPSASTCTISPNPVDLGGSSPMTASVAVTTARRILPQGGPPVSLRHKQLGFTQLACSMVGVLMLIPAWGCGQNRNPRSRTTLSLVGLFLLAIPLLGCEAFTGAGGTPTGTYTLVVTGVSGSIHQSIILSLKVM